MVVASVETKLTTFDEESSMLKNPDVVEEVQSACDLENSVPLRIVGRYHVYTVKILCKSKPEVGSRVKSLPPSK